MNVLEYNSGFDFIDMMNEFDYEYVKFMGGRANGTYMLGIDDEDEMLYMELPADDYDGRVRKVVALGLKQSIILPGRINYLCDSTTHMNCDCDLAIDSSALKVNSMFYNSKGLSNLTFEGCSLTDLRKLTLGSDIKEIEFKKCKFILDNDQLVNYDGVSALTVFGSKIEKLMLRKCSKDFVELVMKLFDGEWDLFPRLEIEILD